MQNAKRCVNRTEAQERAHLEHVVRKIEAELDAFGSRLGSRMSQSRDMIVAIQEQKRDMDHAEKAVMRQAVNVMTTINEQGAQHAGQLARLVESPYFGRIDLDAPDDEHDRPVYIGLHSFYDAETDTQLVHDWRAPISGMFYDFELGPAHFDAPSGRIRHEIVRKRQYQIESRTLRSMLEASLSIQDDILREQLSRASDDAMKNIVATIQREQNEIIRNDRSRTLVIQGAAGSGKTSIALHRIAFLLYRYRDEISSNDIMIVSPNKVFADYISKVLPELGEAMIRETSMESIASQALGARFKAQTFAEQVARLLEGDDAYAERVRFKATPGFLTALDDYIAHIRATNFTPGEISIPPYSLEPDWVRERARPYSHLPILEQITKTVDSIVEHAGVTLQKSIKGKERASIRSQLTSMHRVTSLPALYKGFYEWCGQPAMFRKATGGRYEYSDVFPLVYLGRLTDHIAPMTRIKHLVIDEMQDYTPIQYKVIDAIFSCNKTILGDAHQSVSPLSSSNAESIAGALRDAECVYMHKSYRSTIEITRLSQTLLHNPRLEPIERHGETPALIACPDRDREFNAIRAAIEEFRRSDWKTMGIVCKTNAEASRLFEALDEHGVHLLDPGSGVFSGGAMITTAFLAKGLEFDHVLVPFCDDETYRAVIDKHMLYIACTRAMHRLTVLCSGEPSRFLKPALEQSLLRVQA